MTILPLVFDAPLAREAAAASGRPRPGRAPGGRRPSWASRPSGPISCRGTTSAGCAPTCTTMTDLPAAAAAMLGAGLLPPLLTEVRQLETDAGTTRKTLWRLFDGTLVESVLMAYRDRVTVCVSSQAGCGMACPFCATGQGGLRRNLSTAEIVEQVAAAARPGRGSMRSSAVECRVHGHGRAARELQPGGRRAAPAGRSGAGRASGSRSARSPSRPSAWCRPSTGWPTRASTSRWPSRCTRPTTSCATRWCRSTPGGRSPRCSPRPTRTRPAPGRRYSIEYAMIRDINDQPWRADLLGELLSRGSRTST